MTIQLRYATPADAPAIAQIICSAFQEPANPTQVQIALTHAQHTTIVAHLDETLIGFVDGFFTSALDGTIRQELDLLAVHPEYQGRGIAKRLIRQFTAPDHLTRALVATDNTRMQSTMRRMHFRALPQTYHLYISEQSASPIPMPAEAHCIPVTTMNYSGLWLEGQMNHLALQAAHALRSQQNLDLVGILVTDNTQAQRLVQAGFTHIKAYHWWLNTQDAVLAPTTSPHLV